MEAKDIFKAYSILQEELCLALMNLYNLKRDSEILDIPKSGMFFLKNKTWRFARHGEGVCFFDVDSHEIVDAHRYPFKFPSGIDAWRLLEYFDSKNLKTLFYKGKVIDVSNENAVNNLINQLFIGGILILADTEYSIYSMY